MPLSNIGYTVNQVSVQSLAALLLGIGCMIVLNRLFRAIRSPLRRLPGPFLARFTRLWYLGKISAGNFEQTNQHLHERYGKIVRIAPNEYSINDPESWKIIYGHGTGFIKSSWYVASGNADPDSHDLFTDRDSKRHAIERRKVAHLYSMTNLVQYEPYVESCIQQIMKRFDQFAEDGSSFNMQSWLQYYAFDVIGMITFNKRFGFLDEGKDQGGLIEALDAYLVYAANVGVYSEWHRILSKLLALLPSSGMAYLVSFTQEQIATRSSTSRGDKEDGDMQDFLTRLLEMRSANPEKINTANVFTACITNIGAGSDTTSISLSAIIYHLLRSPSTMEKLRNEVVEQSRGKSSDQLVTFKDAQSMPYLQACIKEALRLHPATGLPLGRVVPDGGATICGTFFPGGTVIGVNTWVAHHNQDIFGADSHIFRPERWLEADSEQLSLMEKNSIAFGLGSRTCIGKNISLLEISKLIPEIVKRYDIELVNPEKALDTQNNWFVKQKNFCCRVKRRVI